MTSRKSSRSIRAASSVDPTRSQNITVSCRRSAPAEARAEEDGGASRLASAAGDGMAVAEETPAETDSGAPQSPQNLLPGTLGAPHEAQVDTSGEPQSLQKRFESGLGARHFGHSMSGPEFTERIDEDYREG